MLERATRCERMLVYRVQDPILPVSQADNTREIIGFELVLFAGWGVIPTFGKSVGLGNEFYLMLALNM